MNVLQTIVPPGELTLGEFRQWIGDVEKRMCEIGGYDRHTEDSPCGTKHTFTPGLYTREIFMPAGSLIVSRIHMFEHPFVISQGKVSVYDGKEVVTLTAPFQGVTSPGTKRLLYVHEDTTWTTFHVTDKSTFEEIDQNGVITCDTFEEFERIIRKEITVCPG